MGGWGLRLDSNILVEDCLDLVAEWLPVWYDHFVLTALSQQHSAVLQDPDIAMLCHDVRHDNSGVTWKMFSGRGQDSQWLYSPGHELDDISPVWTSIHSALDQFSSLQFSPQSLNRNLVHIQLKNLSQLTARKCPMLTRPVFRFLCISKRLSSKFIVVCGAISLK